MKLKYQDGIVGNMRSGRFYTVNGKNADYHRAF